MRFFRSLSTKSKFAISIGGLSIAISVVLVVTLFPTKPSSGNGMNISLSLATVQRGTISSQTQQSAVLQYSGSYTVTIPAGISPTQLTSDQQAVATDQLALANAETSTSATQDSLAVSQATESLSLDQSSLSQAQDQLAIDQATVSGDQAQLEADQQRQAFACQGANSASSTCSSDIEVTNADKSKLTQDQAKVTSDTALVSQDQDKINSDNLNIQVNQAKATSDSGQAQGQQALDAQKLQDDQAQLAAGQQQETISTSLYAQVPAVGAVVSQGEILYSVGQTNVGLLYGDLPQTRSLYLGESGPDVGQLNNDLYELGYTSAPKGSLGFTSGTQEAVSSLQQKLGDLQSGTLPLGEIVFLPSTIKVTTVTATPGEPVQAGGIVLTGTSTTREVVIELDADLASQVKTGDPVGITLPDNSVTPGLVTKVGTIATCPSGAGSNGGGGSSSPNGCSQGSSPTIEVDVTPTDPGATGTLDQAPVEVSITNQSEKNTLIVPVTALVALSGGGYAVEVVPRTGSHYLVGVTTGIFDDADGTVQVSGAKLKPGMKVVTTSQ